MYVLLQNDDDASDEEADTNHVGCIVKHGDCKPAEVTYYCSVRGCYADN